MKVLCFTTSAGAFYCEGQHPDKIAHILKNIAELGWTWDSINLLEMTPEAYQRIPATNASYHLFTRNEP
jgi:hypothetical protein